MASWSRDTTNALDVGFPGDFLRLMLGPQTSREVADRRAIVLVIQVRDGIGVRYKRRGDLVEMRRCG